MPKRKGSSDRSATPDRKSSRRGSRSSSVPLNASPTSPMVPKHELFVNHPKPNINLAIISSDSSVDVASMARLLHFQVVQVLGNETSRHLRLSSNNSFVGSAEMERTRQYIAELERAKAVRAGAPLHEEMNPDRGNEEENSGGKGRKKGGGNAAAKRAGAAARKQQQQAEEELLAMSPEHLKELEEERQRLMDTYLKNYEFTTVVPNSVAEFDGQTQMLFIYELLGQEEVLTAQEDGTIGDVHDAFWRTIEAAAPPGMEEITVIWAVSDVRLLKALKESPPREPGAAPAGEGGSGGTAATQVGSASPTTSAAGASGVPAGAVTAAASTFPTVPERHIRIRMILYANDAQFTDPTLSAPNTGENAKRSSRFSMAKKGGNRKLGSQGSEGSRNSSRNSRGGKGNQKNANAPSDSAPANFFESGVVADDILFECQTFGEFIDKQMLLQKQKAELQKILDSTKPPNSDCDPNLLSMLSQDEPGIRLTAVAPPEDVPNPLEAHLNKQKALRPGSTTPTCAASSVLTASKSLTAMEVNPSFSSGRGSNAMALSNDGPNASSAGVMPVSAPAPTIPPPDPIWSVIRAVQTGTNAAAEEDWINTCRRKGVCPIFELASIVSIYNHWRSQKKFTDLPPSLRWQQDQRLQCGFTQVPKDAFRPYRYDMDDMKMFIPGVSQDELRARKEPVTEGGFQVYEREKLLGGEFIPYTALLALISQASCNLTRAQPYQLVQLEVPEALPPMLEAVCQQQKAAASKNFCPIFKVNTAEEVAAIGDNRGSASVAVEVKPVVAAPEPLEAREPSPSPGLKGKDAKGRDTKKSPGKRPGTSKHDAKEEVAPPPPPSPPRPTAWAFPMDHCHDNSQTEASPQEVEWLVQQYTKKGLGRFFYSKRGCTASPAKITARGAGGTDKMSQQAKSEILQAVHMMREFHGSRIGGQLLPQAEEAHQRVFLFRTCYGFLQHLNKCSLNASLQDPRSSLFCGVNGDTYPLANNCFWNMVPQDLVAKLTKPLTHQEEQLKLSVERNLTARERAHVIQRSLLVELARAVGLLPPSTKMLDETPLNIEEVVTLSTALHRLAEFPLRFGQHIASIFSFASEEMDKSHVESVMAASYAAKHSMNAENVYPVRRAIQFFSSGIPIPPYRRKNLIWLFPVSGCLPVDQFIAWKRWVSRGSGSPEDSYSRGGPVTFASNPVFGEEERRNSKKEVVSKHGKLATDFMEMLLSKVLNYSYYHTSKQEEVRASHTAEKKPSSAVEQVSDLETTVNSQRGMEIGKIGNIAPEHLKNFELGKDLYLATEGRRVLYPFCDSVVEIATTNYSRQCRFISTKEVTATLQYNIPLPITDGDMSDLLYALSKRSAPVEETAYLTVRFDDGLTVTIANRAKPPARLSHPRLSKTSRTAEGEPSVTSLMRNSMSVMSTSSKKGKEKKKREKRTTSKRRNSRNNPAEAEKPQEAAQQDTTVPAKQLPPLCPPIAPNGDVRLWTAREELSTEEVPSATASGTTAAFNHPAAANTGTTGTPALTGQHIFEEPLKRKSKIEPLDITIASSNFTFHNREREGMLWFSYSLSQSSATPHLFSLPETIFCVHCNEGHVSKLEASLEREVRRSVEEATGVVVRYFESGMTQTLFPDGAVLSRFKEVGANPTGVPQRAVLLGEDQSSERFCETLTLTTGSVYVRSVYSNSGNRFFIDTDLCEEVSNSFTAIETFRDQRIVYDATQHCHTMTREDGVIVVYYYTRNTVLECAPGMTDTIQSSCPDEFQATNGTTSSATPLVRTLTEKLRRMETWDGTLVSAELTQTGSLDDVPEVYARVTLHADGTTITTFGENVDGLSGTCTNSKSIVSEVVDPNIAPSIVSLLNDARVVHAACQGPVKWCIESPRIPRVFLISVPDRLEQLTQTMHEWHMSFQGTTPFSLADTVQGVVESQYDSFYLVFGDGSVLKRHLLSRPTRGTVVPFLETVISRPTDTAVRIIHDNGIAVVERAVDVKRNSENPASAAIGEGFAVFDLALGGFRLVDYLSHVTEVQNIYSPFGVSASMTPVSWETLLKELVHDTYSAHRLPKAQMERMAAKREQEEQEERAARASGICPPLKARMRELAEEFVVCNGLLKPDVLHTLEKAGLAAKGLSKDDIAKATAESQGAEPGLLSTTMGQISPIFLCQRANGEVVQFLSEQAMERVVEEEGISELNPDPVYLLRSIASGEPGVQQLSLFRVGSNERSGPPDHRSTTAALLAGSRDHHKKGGSTPEPGSLRDAMERSHKLSSFYNGTSFAAHYHHADNPTFDYTVGDPSQYLGSFSRWQPRECQPPRRFLKPPVRRDKTKGGVVELHEDDTLLLQKSSHENVRTFLQFQPVSSTAANTVLNAELQRSRQLSDLTQYHQVMQGSFPEVPSAAMDEQKRLQQLYFSMRGCTR